MMERIERIKTELKKVYRDCFWDADGLNLPAVSVSGVSATELVLAARQTFKTGQFDMMQFGFTTAVILFAGTVGITSRQGTNPRFKKTEAGIAALEALR
jgi:hypothetical protein